MLYTRNQIRTILDNELNAEDKTNLKLITDLSWAAAITLEFGFQCPEKGREELKQKFFEKVEKLSEIRKTIKMPVDTEEYEFEFSPIFPAESRLTWEDFGTVCYLFYKLVEHDKKVTKEKMLEFLQRAWDSGVHQQKVYSMEVEGSVLNEIGIITMFGFDLAMFGKRNGILPT